MIRRPPRSTRKESSAASDVYKRQPFTLSKPEHVVISIYDVKGHLIRKLYLGKRKRGVYLSKSRAAYWDGRNEKGEEVASGVYFYLMEAGRFKRQRKMVLVR